MTKKIRLQAPFGDLGCQRPGFTSDFGGKTSMEIVTGFDLRI